MEKSNLYAGGYHAGLFENMTFKLNPKEWFAKGRNSSRVHSLCKVLRRDSNVSGA